MISMQIVLATTSPYRREAFKYLELDFITQASNVDESKVRRDNPEELVLTLAKLKADRVAGEYSDAIVIGLDSVGYFKGKILEKPKSKEENAKRLKMLSGKTHEFITGIYMVNIKSGESISRVVRTKVYLRKLSNEDINKYLDEDESWKTLAAGYNALDHYSATFVKRIEGSPHNLLSGIPLEIIPELLRKLGYDYENMSKLQE